MSLRQRTLYRRTGRADWLRTCKKVGEILKKNGFPKNILLVADKNTLRGFVLKFEDAALTGCSEKSSRFERDKFTGYFLHLSLKP